MTLKIECEEYYHQVCKTADELNCRAAFQRGLDRLEAMAGKDTCYLHADFAPLSFAFLISDGSTRGLVGGLIYSGPGHILNGSAPSFTVSVEPHSNEHRWSVHT